MKLNLITFLILFVIFKSYAEDFVHLKMDEESNVFQNQVNNKSVLVISSDSQWGEVFDLEINRYMIDKKINQIDPGCNHQNMVYYPPFLVSTTVSCLVDFESKTIKFLGEVEPPRDSFSFKYIYQDEINIYFLINGRIFPHATHGYLKVKAINKETGKPSIWDLSNDVPGFSGDMALNQELDIVYYTLATGASSNLLFTLPLEALRQAIKNRTTINFLEIANRVTGPFQGLSFNLLEGDELLLYVNRGEYGNYDNYFIHKISGHKNIAIIPDNCLPVGIFDNRWLFNCHKNEIRSFYTQDLLD